MAQKNSTTTAKDTTKAPRMFTAEEVKKVMEATKQEAEAKQEAEEKAKHEAEARRGKAKEEAIKAAVEAAKNTKEFLMYHRNIAYTFTNEEGKEVIEHYTAPVTLAMTDVNRIAWKDNAATLKKIAYRAWQDIKREDNKKPKEYRAEAMKIVSKMFKCIAPDIIPKKSDVADIIGFMTGNTKEGDYRFSSAPAKVEAVAYRIATAREAGIYKSKKDGVVSVDDFYAIPETPAKAS